MPNNPLSGPGGRHVLASVLLLAVASATPAFAQSMATSSQEPEASVPASPWSGHLDAGIRPANRDVDGALKRSSLDKFASAGVDYAASDALSFGFGISASHSRSELDSGGALNTNTYSPEIHIAYQNAGWRLDGYGAYTFVRYRPDGALQKRTDLVPANTDPNSGGYGFGGSIGYDFVMGDFVFTPGADIAASYSRVDQPFRLKDKLSSDTAKSSKQTSASLGVGAQLTYARELDWGTVTMSAKGRYYTDLSGAKDGIVFGYAARPDVSLDLAGSNSGSDYGVIELGLNLASHGGVYGGVSYSPRFDSHGLIDHVGEFRLGVAF